MKRNIAGSFLALFLAVLAAGCSSKPPGCSDEQTVELVKETLKRDLQATLDQSWALIVRLQSDGGTRIKTQMNDYLSGLNIDLKHIVSNGYDANAKMHQCAGKLSAIHALTGSGLEYEATYTVQATEDKTGFVVRVATNHAFLKGMAGTEFGKFGDAQMRAKAAAVPAPTLTSETPSTSSTAAPSKELLKCLDRKIAAHRKEVGEQADIGHQLLEEWEGACAKGT